MLIWHIMHWILITCFESTILDFLFVVLVQMTSTVVWNFLARISDSLSRQELRPRLRGGLIFSGCSSRDFNSRLFNFKTKATWQWSTCGKSNTSLSWLVKCFHSKLVKLTKVHPCTKTIWSRWYTVGGVSRIPNCSRYTFNSLTNALCDFSNRFNIKEYNQTISLSVCHCCCEKRKIISPTHVTSFLLEGGCELGQPG